MLNSNNLFSLLISIRILWVSAGVWIIWKWLYSFDLSVIGTETGRYCKMVWIIWISMFGELRIYDSFKSMSHIQMLNLTYWYICNGLRINNNFNFSDSFIYHEFLAGDKFLQTYSYFNESVICSWHLIDSSIHAYAYCRSILMTLFNTYV